METLRIGIVGAGNIFRRSHVPGLRALDGVELVAVANRTLDSSRRAAAEYGIAEVEDDWQSLVRRSDLDVIFIGTWPYMHREISIAVLRSGKHCFCQARMAGNLEDARAMLAAAEAHPDLVAVICPPPTRMPFEPFLRQLIDSGELGQLTLVHLQSALDANLHPGVSWREQTEYSGQQILWMGIFAETLHALVGEYDTLTAHTSTPLSPKVNDRGLSVPIEIPQVLAISGRLKSGTLAAEIHTGLAADSSTPGHQLTVWGLKGTLRYAFGEQVLFAKAGQAFQPVDVPAELQKGWQVERDFIEAVRLARQGKSWSFSPTFREGVAYMRKVAAVHESAASGKAVRPDDL